MQTTKKAGAKPRTSRKATRARLVGDLGIIEREKRRRTRRSHKKLNYKFEEYPRRRAQPATDLDAQCLKEWNDDKAQYIALACQINDDYFYNGGTGLHLHANELAMRLKAQRFENPALKFLRRPQLPSHCISHIALHVVQYYISLWQKPSDGSRPTRATPPPDAATIPLYFDHAHYNGADLVLAFDTKLAALDETEGAIYYNAVRFRTVKLYYNKAEEGWEMVVCYKHIKPNDTNHPLQKRQRKNARKTEVALVTLHRMEQTMRHNGISMIKGGDLAKLLGLRTTTALGNAVRVLHPRTRVRIDGGRPYGYSRNSIRAAIQRTHDRMEQAAAPTDPKALAKQSNRIRRRLAPAAPPKQSNGDGDDWSTPHINYNAEVEEDL